MKKIVSLMLASAVLLTACSSPEQTKETKQVEETKQEEGADETQQAAQTLTDGVFEGKGVGYGGEMKLALTVANGQMSDIEILESKESSPIEGRMLEVLKNRILDAQTPVVDSVTGATFSSYAVKHAVAEAAKEAGVDFGEITMTTSGPAVEMSEGETEHTQVVVVGGGPAGLSAAIGAKENGIDDVILVEKMDILSGNGKFDMSFFDVINSRKLQEQNAVVSKEEFIAGKAGGMDSPERVARWAEEAWNLDSWLRGMDIELNSNSGTVHQAEDDAYAGEEIQSGLEKTVRELGVDVRTHTKGVDLIFDGKKVVGVKVESKEKTYDIMADAVILATGGFCSNKELLAEYAPENERLNTSNQYGTTGDFIPVFLANDIQLSHMEKVSVFKTILKPRRDLTGAGGGGDGFLFINENGERFIGENTSGLELANAILEQKKCFYVFDKTLLDTTFRLQKHVGLGYYLEAQTLEELAELMGVPAEKLVATVDSYNKAVAGEQADLFRETPYHVPFSAEGPYYAQQVESANHMTKGGVLANENAQVLYNDNTVVEGLYAGGEVTATDGAYSTSVMFGHVAGIEAAHYVLGK